MPLSKNQERILTRLERKYDKASEPTRTFYTDRADIYNLFNAGAIDHDHATHLLGQAKKTWKDKETTAREKAKPKRQLTPISTALYKRRTGPNMLDQAQQGLSAGVQVIQRSIALMIFLVVIGKVIF